MPAKHIRVVRGWTNLRPMNFSHVQQRGPGRTVWSMPMRVLSLVMSAYLFVLPQMLTSQYVVAIFEDCGSQPPPIIEEEVLKHAVPFEEHVRIPDPEPLMTARFLQFEEEMLDHPVLEVPDQPPR